MTKKFDFELLMSGNYEARTLIGDLSAKFQTKMNNKGYPLLFVVQDEEGEESAQAYTIKGRLLLNQSSGMDLVLIEKK